MIKNKLVNIFIILFALLSIFFVICPEYDIVISGLFYDNGNFIYKKQYIAWMLYRFVPVLTKFFVVACVVYSLYFLVKYKSFTKLLRSSVFFLIISASIAPGLIVNSVLKEEFGRARPREIKEFGGKKQFTSAFTVTDQCNSNCSFSSGHAAMAFYFSVLAYVAGRRYFSIIYILGVTFGMATGFSRIVMGGHFASDIVASGFIVLLLNHIIYLLWQRFLVKT